MGPGTRGVPARNCPGSAGAAPDGARLACRHGAVQADKDERRYLATHLLGVDTNSDGKLSKEARRPCHRRRLRRHRRRRRRRPEMRLERWRPLPRAQELLSALAAVWDTTEEAAAGWAPHPQEQQQAAAATQPPPPPAAASTAVWADKHNLTLPPKERRAPAEWTRPKIHVPEMPQVTPEQLQARSLPPRRSTALFRSKFIM